MKLTTKVKCPYCGFENVFGASDSSLGTEIIWCDCEQGGCDKPFAVRYSAVLKTNIAKIDYRDLFPEYWREEVNNGKENKQREEG